MFDIGEQYANGASERKSEVLLRDYVIRPQSSGSKMGRSSRWEPEATHQVGKTRVRPQRVPEWFHFKVAETTGALLVSLVEPREGLILLTEPGIDNSERKGRCIPLLRGRLKLFKQAESLTSLTQPRMRSWREIAIATHNASIRSLRGLSTTLT